MKQTAVQWLKKTFEDYGSPFALNVEWNVFDKIIAQAIEMEREQIGYTKKTNMDIKEKALSSWENCDGCNGNDKLFYINGYQKGYNQALADNKEMKYTKEDVLKAGEMGEINHHDYKHIVSLLDEAKELNNTTEYH